MDFDQLFSSLRWKPIRGCPGRYVLRGGLSGLHPSALAGEDAEVREHSTALADDPVLVIEFDGGGLISYRNVAGGFVHTLNTTEGLRRKLEQLGLFDSPPHTPRQGRPSEEKSA